MLISQILQSALVLATLMLNPGNWEAGTVLEKQYVDRLGTENFFSVEPVGDKVFARMQGKSFPKEKNARIKRENLRYLRLLHYNYEGDIQTGELVCNSAVADELLGIFRELYNKGYRINKITLVDNYDGDDLKSMADDNTSSFNYRVVSGSTKLSRHALGMAVDINPLYNPYVTKNKVEPSQGRKYTDRSKKFDHKIDNNDLAVKLFKAKGWTWGGDWKSVKDYQHFEKRTDSNKKK